MCGYLFAWDFSGNRFDLKDETKELAYKFLKYRGPDEFNIKEYHQGFAIHARLKIRGGSVGAQPINTDKSVFLYNGELYNIEESYQSDTQFFFDNFRNIKNQKIDLDGIFSAVYLDKDKNQVFMIRDEWGTKPLFYLINNSIIYVSSSLRLLSKLKPITLNKEAISNYRTLGFFPNDSTPFNEIRKGVSGAIHSIFFKNNDIIFQTNQLKKTNKKYQGIKSLEDAVNSQLVSDVPVGLLLSGGVDSSILAKILDKNRNINCFNVTSSNFKNLNEKNNLKIIDKSIKNNIFSIEINIENIEDTFNKAIEAIDIPVADSSIILNYEIYKKMNEYDTPVCLTGVGADELFGGYTRFTAIKFANLIRNFGWITPRFILTFISRFFSNARIKKFILNRCQNYIDLFSDTDINNESKYFVPMRKEDILNFERQEYLINALLSFTDNISMAHSIEARVPYLSKHIANLNVLNNNYFSDKKSYLKRVRRKLYKTSFDEQKKGFAIKNNELNIFDVNSKINNRKDFGEIVLNRWLANLGVKIDT